MSRHGQAHTSLRRRPPTSAPSSHRLLRAWSLLSTCAALGIAAWHFAAPSAPRIAAAPAACPPPIVLSTCAAPPSPGEPATDEPDAIDEPEIDEPAGEPFRLPLDPLVVGDEEDERAFEGDRPARYGEGDWDDDEVVVWRRRVSVGRAALSARGPTGAASLPPGCLASPLCVLASLGAGGPVPDSAAGLGYLFGRARDDLHRGDFAGAAHGFLAAVARLPEPAAPADAARSSSGDDASRGAVALDRRWLCRSAALALAAAATNGDADADLFARLCAARPAAAPLPSPDRPATPTHG